MSPAQLQAKATVIWADAPNHDAEAVGEMINALLKEFAYASGGAAALETLDEAMRRAGR